MCDELQEAGYEVLYAHTLRPTLQLIKEKDPEVILLDVDANTAGKVKRITQAARAHFSRPFVVLLKSGRARPDQSLFFDEVLVKPFVSSKLRETVDKLLASRPSYVIVLPPFVLDRRTQVLLGPRGKVRLNPKMARLMEIFMLHPQQTLSQLLLMKEVWQLNTLKDIRTLHVHIRWLREQIEPDPSHPSFLKTAFRNRGYMLALKGKPTIGGEPLLPDTT
jgi:DNA-binding response OmpR family regulator